MAKIPANPKIHHITHASNLPRIVRAGRLWSDAKRVEFSLDCEIVGMSSIKQRRQRLPVTCHPGTTVGEYVPFYFCPRSIMLYILYMGNYPELSYHGGQRPIVHLQADLHTVVKWADTNDVRWALSDRNAGAYFASFYTGLEHLDRVDWDAVHADDFRAMEVKEGKQAELLVYESFPWNLVEKVGVMDQRIAEEVRASLTEATHEPLVSVEQSWYYP